MMKYCSNYFVTRESQSIIGAVNSKKTMHYKKLSYTPFENTKNIHPLAIVMFYDHDCFWTNLIKNDSENEYI